jgi:hypothetical protein
VNGKVTEEKRGKQPKNSKNVQMFINASGVETFFSVVLFLIKYDQTTKYIPQPMPICDFQKVLKLTTMHTLGLNITEY